MQHRFQKGHKLSEETKKKIGDRHRRSIKFNCDYCGKENERKPSAFNKTKNHFCNLECFGKYTKDHFVLEDCPAYKGIKQHNDTNSIYHKRWRKKNPDKVAHNAAKHYALKRNAEGSHSLQEWKDLKLKYWNRCAFCRQNKPLSKDHIIPLTKGGANYISNIQPLCKNCNSKKSNKLNFDYKTYCNIQNMINKEFIKKLKETNLCNNPNEAAQGILFGFLISEMNEYPELENLLFNSGLFPYERFQEYQIQLCKTNESGNLELIIPLTGYDVKDNEFDQFISILETHNTSTLGHVNNQTGFSIFSVGREDLLAYYKTKEELNAQFNIEKLAIVVSSYYETADYPSKLQNLLGTKNIIGLYKNYVNN